VLFLAGVLNAVERMASVYGSRMRLPPTEFEVSTKAADILWGPGNEMRCQWEVSDRCLPLWPRRVAYTLATLTDVSWVQSFLAAMVCIDVDHRKVHGARLGSKRQLLRVFLKQPHEFI